MVVFDPVTDTRSHGRTLSVESLQEKPHIIYGHIGEGAAVHIERINLQNFRSFGPEGQSIAVDPDLTTLVGANGAGKTVLMQALQRMFGISNEQRTIRRQDFHIPSLDEEIPCKRTLMLEAIVAFPELDDEDGDHSVIPDFFHHMSVTDEGGKLKCRLRLDAEWEDDGSIEG